MYDILYFYPAIPLLELYPASICTNVFFPTLFSVEKKLETLKMIPRMELVKYIVIWAHSRMILCIY